ncbi:MAG: DUF2589 domain-containing protein [Bacteroidetes bacterium]|uniref:DUF2589 domain-containing protein n=1 Tax=Phnomibacter sp. TaxID=2836217 RepID=UPI002FDCED8A|nr:DUF2589 domain-containing protein [Bacteroidota bacterium]
MATSKKAAAPARSQTATKAVATRRASAEPVDVATKAIRSVAALSGNPRPLGAPSTNLTSELNNINFHKMIGGPLQAAIEAQTASAMATINFINAVGFTEVDGKKELVMVDFSHTKKDVDAEGKEVTSESFIKVPLLAMLPIPSIRIETVDINFNVKLNSVETANTSDKLNVAAEVKGGFGPVSFKVSASYQRQSSTGVKVEKEYSLNVKVKATQDEMPAGLEKILNMLAS